MNNNLDYKIVGEIHQLAEHVLFYRAVAEHSCMCIVITVCNPHNK